MININDNASKKAVNILFGSVAGGYALFRGPASGMFGRTIQSPCESYAFLLDALVKSATILAGDDVFGYGACVLYKPVS